MFVPCASPSFWGTRDGVPELFDDLAELLYEFLAVQDDRIVGGFGGAVLGVLFWVVWRVVECSFEECLSGDGVEGEGRFFLEVCVDCVEESRTESGRVGAQQVKEVGVEREGFTQHRVGKRGLKNGDDQVPFDNRLSRLFPIRTERIRTEILTLQASCHILIHLLGPFVAP